MTASDKQSALQSLQGLVGGGSRGSAVERLPMLRVGLEKVAQACAEDLRGLGSVPMKLVLQGVEGGTAGELLAGERGSNAVAFLDAPGWATRLVVCAPRATMFAIVESLLGSDGAQPAQAVDRPLSKIEIGIAGVFFASIAKGFAAAFVPIAPSVFNLAAAADQPDFERLARTEPMVAVKYRLQALEVPVGELLVAIPRVALEALQKPLSRVPTKDAARPDPGWTKQIEKEVNRARVTLTAILDERPGTLGEITQFRIGDIIELKANPQSRLRIECNGERVMWCDLGKSNGVYTLRFDAFVDREQEFIEEIRAA
jgi:flagellar motor switch protein FliM